MSKSKDFEPFVLSKRDLKEITQAIKNNDLSSNGSIWAKYQALNEYLNLTTNKIMEIILTEIDSQLTIVPRPLKSNATLLPKMEKINGPIQMVQDLAGLRIVKNFSLREQDELCEKIETRFAPYLHHTKDRRAEPNYGYRALHVILKVEKIFVEIQIRTQFQHNWADTFELFADKYGRQMRYGGLPTETFAAKDEVLREIFGAFMNWSLEGTTRLEEVINRGIKGDSLQMAEADYRENVRIISEKLRQLDRLQP